jgi:hypothetical protein
VTFPLSLFPSPLDRDGSTSLKVVCDVLGDEVTTFYVNNNATFDDLKAEIIEDFQLNCAKAMLAISFNGNRVHGIDSVASTLSSCDQDTPVIVTFRRLNSHEGK